MKTHFLAVAALALGMTVLAGCSKQTVTYRFEIVSDTSWTATYHQVGSKNETVVSGTGDKTIPVPEAPPVCITVTKNTTGGTVQVSSYKHVHNRGGLFSSDDQKDILQERDSTSDPHGETGVCTE